MLTRLQLEYWKSFGVTEALVFGGLTLLVGPNGSGKSNVLDALRFLQGACLDLPLADVLRGRYEGQREVWPGIRGGGIEAAHAGMDHFTIRTGWNAQEPLAHSVEVSVARRAVIRSEELADSWGELEHAGDRVWSVWPKELSSLGTSTGLQLLGHEAPQAIHTLESDRLAAVQLDADNSSAESLRRTKGFVSTMRALVFLDVQPWRMRDYRPEGATQIGINGENISPVLRQLGEREPAELQNVVDWLSELCSPAIETIDFDRTQLGEVMMFLVEPGGRKISARSTSDGTLRFLGLIVALLTVPEGSIIILEEPDVGLHPSRIHLLASLLEDTARRRSLQIIATTHSPTLLSHLSPEALADVLVFGRSPDDGTTIGKRLGDLPHFATLRDADNLDHLVSTGWLERAL